MAKPHYKLGTQRMLDAAADATRLPWDVVFRTIGRRGIIPAGTPVVRSENRYATLNDMNSVAFMPVGDPERYEYYGIARLNPAV